MRNAATRAEAMALIHGQVLVAGRRVVPRLMGVVNVTPDSFSDGGRYADPEAAIAHGRQLLADGADILDVGGESTRPGATRPLVEEELARVVPVIDARWPPTGRSSRSTRCAPRSPRRRSRRAPPIVNDVSGGLADPAILDVVAGSDGDVRRDALARPRRPDAGAGAATTSRAASSRPWSASSAERAEAARAAGIPDDRLVLDPGLGIRQDRRPQLGAPAPASTGSQALGFPLLVGASRKSFLGSLLAGADGTPRPVDDREAASTALTLLLAAARGLGDPGARRTRQPRRPRASSARLQEEERPMSPTS